MCAPVEGETSTQPAVTLAPTPSDSSTWSARKLPYDFDHERASGPGTRARGTWTSPDTASDAHRFAPNSSMPWARLTPVSCPAAPIESMVASVGSSAFRTRSSPPSFASTAAAAFESATMVREAAGPGPSSRKRRPVSSSSPSVWEGWPAPPGTRRALATAEAWMSAAPRVAARVNDNDCTPSTNSTPVPGAASPLLPPVVLGKAPASVAGVLPTGSSGSRVEGQAALESDRVGIILLLMRPRPAARPDPFAGPFDLLCSVLLRRELWSRTCRSSRSSSATCERLRRRGKIDPNTAGEFLLLVAGLMEIKARELLDQERRPARSRIRPRIEAQDDMLERLIRYTTFKGAAAWLGESRPARALLAHRVAPGEPPEPACTTARRSTRAAAALDDRAARAAGRRRAPPRRPPRVGARDDRPPARRAAQPQHGLDEAVEGLTRLDQAVAFVAALELCKAGHARSHSRSCSARSR